VFAAALYQQHSDEEKTFEAKEVVGFQGWSPSGYGYPDAELHTTADGLCREIARHSDRLELC
jgi:hypothetical protein